MSPLIDLIIPTWNNAPYLYPCVESILKNSAEPELFKITVVNNGEKGSVTLPKEVDVIDMDHNAGWCGGLNAGLKVTSAPFVVLCNDDILIPESSENWAHELMQTMVDDSQCSAVGPSSNFVMGPQQIWSIRGNDPVFRTPFLIGFFLMVRRSDLLDAGGIDEQFTCGDDMDLSMRLRMNGRFLVANKRVFIFHHGAKTGTRVEGSYWYSKEQTEKTWMLLFKKHGVKQTHEMLMSYA